MQGAHLAPPLLLELAQGSFAGLAAQPVEARHEIGSGVVAFEWIPLAQQGGQLAGQIQALHRLALQQHVGKPGVQPQVGQVLAVGQQGAFGIDGTQLQQEIPGFQ